jgi:methionyl-tRNA formyltransferase
MRLVFLGSPDFAVPTLRALHATGHEVVCVVTQPDRPRGRHKAPQPTPVKRTALELGLPVYQPQSVNAPEAVQHLKATGAEIGVVIAYGTILKPRLIDALPRGFLNVHASLLPDYRGAAPINWALICGEKVVGVSIIRIEPKLDVGPVLGEARLDVMPDETAGELTPRIAVLGAAALAEVIGRLAAGESVPGRVQPAEAGFYARKLTKSDGRLDWTLSAGQVCNRVRGLTPWPGAFSELCIDGRCLHISVLTAHAEPGGAAEPTEAGVVLAAGEDGIVVQAGCGVVRLLRLKPAGKRAMDVRDFVHGHRLRPGARFVSEKECARNG